MLSRAHIDAPQFLLSFDAGRLAFRCKTEKPTRRSASAAVSKETQCKCCRFLFFVLGSLLPLSSCWALSIHKVTEAEIAQNSESDSISIRSSTNMLGFLSSHGGGRKDFFACVFGRIAFFKRTHRNDFFLKLWNFKDF